MSRTTRSARILRAIGQSSSAPGVQSVAAWFLRGCALERFCAPPTVESFRQRVAGGALVDQRTEHAGLKTKAKRGPMGSDRKHHIGALVAVLEAARARLDMCSSGGHTGMAPCDKPAIYTFGSPNVRLYKLHGRPHQDRHDLWPHPQTPLVVAIAKYDAVEAALPDLTEEEPWVPRSALTLSARSIARSSSPKASSRCREGQCSTRCSEGEE